MARRRVRAVPSWLTSAMTHVLLISLLSLCTIASRDKQPPPALISMAAFDEELNDADETWAREAWEDFEVQQVDPSEQSTSAKDADLSQLADASPAAASLGDLLATPTDASGSSLAAASELGELFANANGSMERAGGLEGEATARFFGAEVVGRRILFLLDNSGSMQGGRLETVLAELQRSVAALTPQQEFYVIFFSDDVYPLFYPEAADGYVVPNDKVRESLARWLESVELCYGDVIDEALQSALSIQPDVVFLLSDGKITSQRDMHLLLSPDKPFPIHTFGVGLGNALTARDNLQRIAAANRGEFREAEVPVAMRQLAQKNPRPYRREAPGALWGRRVALKPSFDRDRP